VLLARTSSRSRGWLCALVVLGCAERLLLVATAYGLAREEGREALAFAVATGLIFAATRAVQTLARVSVQRDVYDATSRAVLASDVLAVPTSDVHPLVLDGTFHGILLVAQLAPAFAADVAASLVIVPIVARSFDSRLLVIAGVAMLVVTLVAALLRSMAQKIEQRLADAYGGVIERLLGSIEGRVEIVARAGEDEVNEVFEAQLAEYERLSRRSALGTTVLGRAPLAAGALAVVVVALLDASSRRVVEGALVTKALLLVAALPALHGALLGLHGMLRSVVFVRPLIELLGAPPRHDRARVVRKVATLPTTVRGRALGFAYDAAGTTLLSGVSFDWTVDAPLVIVGPNGAGKSTLLKLLLGLRLPTEGSITFGEFDASSIDWQALRRASAYLPQRPFLGEAHGTVRAAMQLAVPGASDEAMQAALERTGVFAMLREHGSDELATPVGELSAGQRQRVALARILLQNARMVLLDEPDANLDTNGIRWIADLVSELRSRGVMVAIAAHTPELAELTHANRLELHAR
jgi:ATP-binding cassette subfamily C protein CydD